MALNRPHRIDVHHHPYPPSYIAAREWNEYMAQMARDHPGRFGVFAELPILDATPELAHVICQKK